MKFYWSNKEVTGSSRPSGCAVATSGGAALPCTGAISGCTELDATQLTDGYCNCATCEAVQNCATQASGASCACTTCEEGYVSDAQGQCQLPSAPTITETLSAHTVGGVFALEHGWTQHNQGRVRGRRFAPRAIQSTTCTPAGATKERVILTWDEHVSWTKGR